MAARALEQQTYLPDQAEGVAALVSFLEAHERVRGTRPPARYLLVGTDEHDSVELPESVYRVLRQVVEAMRAGRAVTVAPQTQTLTTQQAADLLGVSRPTVVKLIDDGELAAETPAKRRRLVKLEDVLAYRQRRRAEQYQALVATSDDYDDLFDTPADAAKEHRAIRAEVAAERAQK